MNFSRKTCAKSRRSVAAAFCAAVCGASFFSFGCGGEVRQESLTTHISFKTHDLKCERSDMRAELQVSGVDGVCPLDLTADRRAEGTCGAVPTGAVRVFKLRYYFNCTPCPGEECPISLAEIDKTVDLTEVRQNEVVLDFSSGDLRTDFDVDNDLRTNLEEFCASGRNPCEPD